MNNSNVNSEKNPKKSAINYFAVIQILNRPITNCCNSDDVSISAAELLQAKVRPVSFIIIQNLLYETKSDRCIRTLKNTW